MKFLYIYRYHITLAFIMGSPLRCILLTYVLITVNHLEASHLQGSLGDYKQQKIMLLHDHIVCFKTIQHYSLRQTIMCGLLCMRSMFKHCLMKSPVEYSGTIKSFLLKMRNSSYCGSIWLKEKPRVSFRETILLEVKRRYNIRLNLLALSLFLDKVCLMHSSWFGD